MRLLFGILLLVTCAFCHDCLLRNLVVVTGDRICETTRKPLGNGAYVKDCDVHFMCSMSGISACPSPMSTDACVAVGEDCIMLEKRSGGSQHICKSTLD